MKYSLEQTFQMIKQGGNQLIYSVICYVYIFSSYNEIIRRFKAIIRPIHWDIFPWNKHRAGIIYVTVYIMGLLCMLLCIMGGPFITR